MTRAEHEISNVAVEYDVTEVNRTSNTLRHMTLNAIKNRISFKSLTFSYRTILPERKKRRMTEAQARVGVYKQNLDSQ